jgi:hypothetical protein
MQINEFDLTNVELKWITPESAKEILDKHNHQNRNPNERNIARYTQDMIDGKWRVNGETIKFRDDGELADGQNRLYAVVRSGTAQQFLVVNNVTKDDMTTVDTGRSRSFGDVLRLNGQFNYHALASACKTLFYYYNPGIEKHTHKSPTHDQLLSFFEDHKDLAKTLGEAHKIKQATELSRPAMSALAYLVQSKHGFDAPLWTEFRDKLVSGAGMEMGDPALALRNFGLQGTSRLKAQRGNNRKYVRDSLIAGAKAWNATVEKREAVKFRVSDAEDYPEVF